MKNNKPTAFKPTAKQKRNMRMGLIESFVLDWKYDLKDETGISNVDQTSIVLYVARSTIQGAGRGLFSNIHIEKGTFITHYTGLHIPHLFSQPHANGPQKGSCLCRILRKGTIEGSSGSSMVLPGKSWIPLGICCLYSNSHKLRSINSDEKIIGIDGMHHSWKYYGVGLGAASWINSKPSHECNCKWDSDDRDSNDFPKRYVVAKDNIKPGDELFVDYDIQERGFT